MTWTVLPTLNAALNATSAVLVTAGYIAIRRRRIAAHQRFMVAAGVTSTLFFISYGVYHVHVGSVPFTGTGWIHSAYCSLLISHTILAIVVVPMVLRTLWLGLRRRLGEHVAWGRWTVPVWWYVSVSGVVVYWMLYRL